MTIPENIHVMKESVRPKNKDKIAKAVISLA